MTYSLLLLSALTSLTWWMMNKLPTIISLKIMMTFLVCGYQTIETCSGRRVLLSDAASQLWHNLLHKLLQSTHYVTFCCRTKKNLVQPELQKVRFVLPLNETTQNAQATRWHWLRKNCKITLNRRSEIVGDEWQEINCTHKLGKFNSTYITT